MENRLTDLCASSPGTADCCHTGLQSEMNDAQTSVLMRYEWFAAQSAGITWLAREPVICADDSDAQCLRVRWAGF